MTCESHGDERTDCHSPLRSERLSKRGRILSAERCVLKIDKKGEEGEEGVINRREDEPEVDLLRLRAKTDAVDSEIRSVTALVLKEARYAFSFHKI